MLAEVSTIFDPWIIFDIHANLLEATRTRIYWKWKRATNVSTHCAVRCGAIWCERQQHGVRDSLIESVEEYFEWISFTRREWRWRQTDIRNRLYARRWFSFDSRLVQAFTISSIHTRCASNVWDGNPSRVKHGSSSNCDRDYVSWLRYWFTTKPKFLQCLVIIFAAHFPRSTHTRLPDGCTLCSSTSKYIYFIHSLALSLSPWLFFLSFPQHSRTSAQHHEMQTKMKRTAKTKN